MGGGTGGGALKIVCGTLILYEGSIIAANGYFGKNDDPLTGGGSGGSIWLKVNKKIEIRNKKKVSKRDPIVFRMEAKGGGMHRDYLRYQTALGGNAVGIGSYGYLRIDYHTPQKIDFKKFYPKKVHIGEGGDAAIDEGKKGHHGLQPSQSGETVDDDYVQRIGNNKQIRFHFGEYDAKCIVTKKKKIVFSQDKNEPFQLSLIPNKKRKEKKEQYKIVCIKGD